MGNKAWDIPACNYQRKTIHGNHKRQNWSRISSSTRFIWKKSVSCFQVTLGDKRLKCGENVYFLQIIPKRVPFKNEAPGDEDQSSIPKYLCSMLIL